MRRSLPGCLPLALLLLPACAAPRPLPAAAAAPAAKSDALPGESAPKWDDPAAVRHLWPQGAGLAEARVLCPYVYPTAAQADQPTRVSYERGAAQRGPFAVHVAFHSGPGVQGSWGVGCLRSYDASRYQYLSLWVKGRPGQRVRFRLRDSGQNEAIIEKPVAREGWQRVTIPTGDFAGVDLRRLANFGLVFDEAIGESDLYLDGLEFTNQ